MRESGHSALFPMSPGLASFIHVNLDGLLKRGESTCDQIASFTEVGKASTGKDFIRMHFSMSLEKINRVLH